MTILCKTYVRSWRGKVKYSISKVFLWCFLALVVLAVQAVEPLVIFLLIGLFLFCTCERRKGKHHQPLSAIQAIAAHANGGEGLVVFTARDRRSSSISRLATGVARRARGERGFLYLLSSSFTVTGPTKRAAIFSLDFVCSTSGQAEDKEQPQRETCGSPSS